MTSGTNPRHHSIDYIEINVLDLKASKNFYTRVFGWEFVDYAPVYCGIKKAGGGEMGGLYETDNVQSGGPLVIIYSDDLEATKQKIEESGGTLVKDLFEFPGGRRFEFKDPSSNIMAVWTET